MTEGAIRFTPSISRLFGLSGYGHNLTRPTPLFTFYFFLFTFHFSALCAQSGHRSFARHQDDNLGRGEPSAHVFVQWVRLAKSQACHLNSHSSSILPPCFFLFTFHPLLLTPHFSLFTFHPSLLTPSASRLLGLSGYGHRRPNPTYATSHASRLTPYPSPLTPHVSLPP